MHLQEIVDNIEPIDTRYYEIAKRRLDSLTKPNGSLGRLEEFSSRIVGITQKAIPEISRKIIFLFASDHGIVEEGVSAFPKDVTRQMVFNFTKGGAAINVLAKHADSEVVVIDIGVEYDFTHNNTVLSKKVVYGTKNMTKMPAMSREEAIESIMVGIDVANKFTEAGFQLFGTGDMGIGNTTPSSAIAAVFSGKPVNELTGRGTGINEECYKRKVNVIEKAIAFNQPNPKDPIDVLAKVGGPEIGGIAGVILGGALKRVPVIIDGFISTAGALIAYNLTPLVNQYIFSAHKSAEKGHSTMLEMMELNPILDLGMKLGEGTGAALAMTFIDAAMKTYREMATFHEANVSKASTGG